MAILPSPKNPLVILRNFRDEITTRTDITNFDRDSKARAVSDTLTNEVLSLREENIQAYRSREVSNARHAELDVVGEKRGVARRLATYGEVTEYEQNIAFYVESGTFGDINGASDITITAGTIISTSANSTELGTVIEYATVGSHTLAAASSIGYINARAVRIGSASNVGATTLTTHNFTDYTDSASDTLKVTNYFPVLNGQDDESDDSYRYRISNRYRSLLQNNRSKIRLEALDVPGVVDFRVEPGYYGVGTAGVIVLCAEYKANTTVIAAVQSRLDSIAGPGEVLTATAAVEVLFDFELDVTPATNLTTTQQTQVRGDINRALLKYFRGLSIGDTIVLSDITEAIALATKRLVSINPVGGTDLYKNRWIRKGVSNGVPDERYTWTGTSYSLETDEFAALGTLSVAFV